MWEKAWNLLISFFVASMMSYISMTSTGGTRVLFWILSVLLWIFWFHDMRSFFRQLDKKAAEKKEAK